MEPQALAAPAVALLAVAATYTDLRARVIPDALNYGALALALVLAHLGGVLTPAHLALVALAFAFAYALYRLGAWAGGDVKFYTALLAYYPLLAPLPADPLGLVAPLALVFLASAALVVPVLFAVHAPRVWKERAAFLATLRASAVRAARAAPLAAAAAVALSKAGSALLALAAGAVLLFVAPPLWLAVLLAGGALAWEPGLALPALGFAFLAFAFITFAQSSFGVLAARVLRRATPLEQLREGAIPAHTLYLDAAGVVRQWEPPSLGDGVRRALATGGIEVMLAPPGRVVVDCLKARGVTEEEIAELRRLGVREVVVKESLPFAPVLALGLAASVLLARGLAL
jgi:preflagellin peptidase FlaK